MGRSLVKRGSIAAAALSLAAVAVTVPDVASAAGSGGPHQGVSHVLLISVDGLHQSDLAWWDKTHPSSTLAKLARDGVDYTDAMTPFPSDSFPGMVGQVTGGNPKTTGVYYDDTWNHGLFPAGTTDCSGTAPGAEVTYFEALDKNLGALDAGQGIVPAPGSDPWADILSMTGQPRDVIDPAQLPVDPSSCQPVYPHQYLKVNTVFEVAHQHGLVTAWSDKHPAYEILDGLSGNGVDDFFTPEINSSSDPANPTSPDAADWTTDNLKTQQYDHYKVEAVLNWIDGHFHSGSGHLGTPAVFGMNFQTVSTAEKLPLSNTEGSSSRQAGGYLSDGTTPGPVLSNAIAFVDQQLGQMVAEVKAQHLDNSTALIISAKHGQSPMDRASLNRIDDGAIIKAMNATWAQSHPGTTLVAQGTDDDGMLLWLNDRTAPATSFARTFLENYTTGQTDGTTTVGTSVDGKTISSAGLQPDQIYAGADAAAFIGVPQDDPRVPDVIGIAQHGTVFTGHQAKIAEHGGDDRQDRNVPILLVVPGGAHGQTNDNSVETTQIAPTILSLLGLDPGLLQAVQIEHTPVLP